MAQGQAGPSWPEAGSPLLLSQPCFLWWPLPLLLFLLLSSKAGVMGLQRIFPEFKC